jgi:sec-independent protein translocase protein TatA
MFGLGSGELVLIAFVVLLLFGGPKIPQLGASLGKAITNFKKGLKEGQDEENKSQITKDQNNSDKK